MKTLLLLMIIVISSTASADVFDDALSITGLNKQSAVFDPLDLAMYGGDDYRLPYFDVYYKDPYRTPERVRLFRDQAGKASEKALDMVSFASSCLDACLRRSLISDPAAGFIEQSQKPDALVSSIFTLWEASGKKPELDYEKRLHLTADAAGIPPQIAQTAAMLLYAEADALKWRNLAFKRLSEKYDMQVLYDHIIDPKESDFDFIRSDLLQRTDLKLLLVGAENLAAAVDKAQADLADVKIDSPFHFEADTPLGKVVLDNAGPSFYPVEESYALIIDAAGDDVYSAGAAVTSADKPVSIIFDLAGDDKYLEAAELDRVQVRDFPPRKEWKIRPNSCAAVMGYAFLVDMAGNDHYTSINKSQGCAAYGAAVLIDRMGSDTYDCYQSGQGSAVFGIAALMDLAGDDSYRCFTTSQGFGGTRGFGILIDAGGNDSYMAENVQIDFPSAQDARHNGNLAQGAGFGERADFTTGHSLAGGIGALVDLVGDDVYVSDIMAQGMGYWYGLGILADGGGSDTYTGYWYNQGSAAHFAVGILNDAGGDDRYIAPCSMVQGAGHDFSLGFLLDEVGNDSYTAAGICLGAGNANGIGIFWDKSGDDVYKPSGNFTLGRANIGSRRSARDFNLCLGLFLDTGGSDSYPDEYAFAQNNMSWTQKGLSDPPLDVEVGIGLDSE